MNDSESLESFFNNSEFRFAKNNEVLEKQNKMEIMIFQHVLLQGTEVNGYISFEVASRLPEGKIYLRIDCDAVTNLDKAKLDVLATDSIVALKQKHHRQNTKPKDIKSAIYFLKKLSVGVEKPKNSLGELTSSFNIPIRRTGIEVHREPHNRLRSVVHEREPIKDACKVETKLGLLEWEVFKLEKSIEKPVYLFLPFRICLDGSICVSTDQIFTKSIEDLQAKQGNKDVGRLPPIVEYGNHIAKLRHDQKWELNSGVHTDREPIANTMTETTQHEFYEYVKTRTKITAYYITNSAAAAHVYVPKTERLARLSEEENYCQATKELTILANYKALGYSPWKKTLELTRESKEWVEINEEIPIKSSKTEDAKIVSSFKEKKVTTSTTFEEKKKGCGSFFSGLISKLKTMKSDEFEKLRVSLSLAQTVFINQDKYLNFVMKFDQQFLKTFKYLDVLVWGKCYYTIEGVPKQIEKILCQESFFLSEKLPNTLMPKIEEKSCYPHGSFEYLNKIFIGNLTSHLQTIDSAVYTMRFGVEFYVSRSAFGLDMLLNEVCLKILKLPEDFVLFDSDYISNIHTSLERNIKEGSIKDKSVMLPYTHILASEKYGDDFKEEKTDEVDQLF